MMTLILILIPPTAPLSIWLTEGALGSVVGNPFDVLKTRMMTAEGTYACTSIHTCTLYLLHCFLLAFLSSYLSSSIYYPILFLPFKASSSPITGSPFASYTVLSLFLFNIFSPLGLVQPSMGDAAKNLYKQQGMYCTVLLLLCTAL